MEFIPAEKAVPLREASTANLLIDSTDRTSGSAADFLINLNASIMNGFFTRLAVAEVVLDWCVDNVSAETGNNSIIIAVDSGGGQSATKTITLPDGQYTIAQCLDQIIVLLNTNPIPNTVFSLVAAPGGTKAIHMTLSGSPSDFSIFSTNLAIELNIPTNEGIADNDFPINCPKLLPYTYIDFVSDSLTYNQQLKDATTNEVSRNVLYRWTFAWDTPAPVDTYGYPIYQGYQRFVARRVLPFPKQIRWSANQPIGQLKFQVISSQGVVLPGIPADGVPGVNGEMEWSMTLLVSEV